MRHEHRVQLRWSDPDMLGHVNHARALSLLEDARLAMMDGRPGGELILARLEADYLRQLYYRVNEPLTVSSWVARLARGPSASARSSCRTTRSRSGPTWCSSSSTSRRAPAGP